jgi:hypothetical protein
MRCRIVGQEVFRIELESSEDVEGDEDPLKETMQHALSKNPATIQTAAK